MRERWPNTPLVRERKKGTRNFISNLTPDPKSYESVPRAPGGGLQRDVRAQNCPVQNPSLAPKPCSNKQPNPYTANRFHEDMRTLSQSGLPKIERRSNPRPVTSKKKDMQPRLVNECLGHKENTPEEVETRKEEGVKPEPMEGNETPPELAGQLNWDLLEPDSVEINLTEEPETKDSQYCAPWPMAPWLG